MELLQVNKPDKLNVKIHFFVNGIGGLSIEVKSNLDTAILNNHCVFRCLNSDIVSNSTFTRYEFFPSSFVIFFNFSSHYFTFAFFLFWRLLFLFLPAEIFPYPLTHITQYNMFCAFIHLTDFIFPF
jgi:hypothetical protein